MAYSSVLVYQIKAAEIQMTTRWEQIIRLFCISLPPSRGHLDFCSTENIFIFYFCRVGGVGEGKEVIYCSKKAL